MNVRYGICFKKVKEINGCSLQRFDVLSIQQPTTADNGTNSHRKEKIHPMKTKYYSVQLAIAMAFLINSVSLFATTTDEAIEKTAQESYIFQTQLKDDTISVTSQDGMVTLSGLVSEEIHKVLAQETVANIAGVKNIDNQLETKPEFTATSDELIKAKVKLELLSHKNLSAVKTDVLVQDGIVTLNGQTKNQAQVDLTTEYIKDVEGVKDVKNNMSAINDKTTTQTIGEKAEVVGRKIGDTAEAVSKKIGQNANEVGESIDDASITALVKATLLFHRSTSAIKTKVDTLDGVVTLTGTARNASEKELAEKFVLDVNGVKSVVNKMNVEGVKTT